MLDTHPMFPLRRSDRTSSSRAPLSRVQLLAHSRVVSLCNGLISFRQDQLYVAWVAHIWIDSTMGSVCSSSLLWCLVDLDVLDNQVIGVEALSIGVGFGVLEETEEEFGRLDWMTGFRDAKVLACERSC